MAELESIDYSTIALSLLIERFKDSEDFKKIFNIIATTNMELQTTFFEIRDKFIITTAEGIELTIIGRIWDVSRRLDITETDDEYRDKIEVKVGLSVSGTIPEIKQILLYFYGATYVTYAADYPAGYDLTTDAVITQIALDSLTAAGVQGTIL